MKISLDKITQPAPDYVTGTIKESNDLAAQHPVIDGSVFVPVLGAIFFVALVFAAARSPNHWRGKYWTQERIDAHNKD